MSPAISLVMDVLIIILLAGTIYFAFRLSKQLRVFRQSRAEFENLFMQLSKQINLANEAIDHMEDAANSHGDKLNKLIRDGQFLADELQMVNEASENMANRIERAASMSGAGGAEIDNSYQQAVEQEDISSPFAIRDKEAEHDVGNVDIGSGLVSEELVDDEGGNFHSQAERELYVALKRGK